MAQNTAMQTLIEQLKSERLSNTIDSPLNIGLTVAISLAINLLPKERQDIEDAGSKCQIVNDVSFDGDIDFMYKSGSDYFNKTFTQNK